MYTYTKALFYLPRLPTKMAMLILPIIPVKPTKAHRTTQTPFPKVSPLFLSLASSSLQLALFLSTHRGRVDGSKALIYTRLFPATNKLSARTRYIRAAVFAGSPGN